MARTPNRLPNYSAAITLVSVTTNTLVVTGSARFNDDVEAYFGTLNQNFIRRNSTTGNMQIEYNQQLNFVDTALTFAKGSYQSQGQVTTTDAAQTIIDSIAVPTNSAITIQWHTMGIRSDGAAAGTIGRRMTYKNNAGVVTLVGAVLNTFTTRDDPSWTNNQVINGTSVDLKVIGVAATTINWISYAQIEVVALV